MLPTRAQQRRRIAAPAAAAGAGAGAMADDRLFAIICNLDCVSVTGWKRIVSYIARKERTDVISLLSVALLHAASAPPRSAKFGLTLLGGVGAFSFNKVRSMNVRFPALHDVVVDVRGGWRSVVPASSC